MSWLHKIIASLTDSEIEKIQNFRLRGKEKEVFNYIFKYRKKNTPDLDVVCSKLNISSTHYYKINSILISKLTFHIFKGETLLLLNWLKKNAFYSLLKVELKKAIEEYSSFEKQKQNSFYLKCFHFCIDLPFEIYDEKLCTTFSKFYLETLDNRNESDDTYIKFHILFADCNRFAASRNPQKMFLYNQTFFDESEAELKKKDYSLALFYLYRTCVSFYSFYDVNPTEALKYILKAISLKDKVTYFFEINISTFLELNYADILLNNNLTKEAFEKYSGIFGAGINKQMYGYHYHAEQYIISAICMGEYEKAESTLNQIFLELINSHDSVNAMRGLLSYVKLNVATNDFKNAIHHMNLATNLNKKNFYLPFDLQLRVLENACFVLKKDFDFARQLAIRNLKFVQGLSSKKIHDEYIAYFKFISTQIVAHSRNKKVTPATLKTIEKLNFEFIPIYGNIIDRMLQILN